MTNFGAKLTKSQPLDNVNNVKLSSGMIWDLVRLLLVLVGIIYVTLGMVT